MDKVGNRGMKVVSSDERKTDIYKGGKGFFNCV